MCPLSLMTQQAQNVHKNKKKNSLHVDGFLEDFSTYPQHLICDRQHLIVGTENYFAKLTNEEIVSPTIATYAYISK